MVSCLRPIVPKVVHGARTIYVTTCDDRIQIGVNSGTHSNPDDGGRNNVAEGDEDEDEGRNSRKCKRSERDEPTVRLVGRVAELGARIHLQESHDANSTAGASGSGIHHTPGPAGAPAHNDNATLAPEDVISTPELKSGVPSAGDLQPPAESLTSS
ncbi:hypothetical protein FRC12_008391 [Ceratobasidium sp. 428]|nr:hypothetical protein FRC12_008391 [Ceratobasidium sp. 428]